MPIRFIGKNLHKRVVKPLKNSFKNQNVHVAEVAKQKITEVIKEEPMVEPVVMEEVHEEKKIKNKKKNKDMVNENKLAQLEAIAGTDMPKMNIKFEKGDKGLYERTENSTILLTEDNKMLLND